ncbi:insecticidal toxin complex protein [Bathymodiolus thermophilus thioautotrophic gill symbiont]|uniref:Insecticidal toxin complex protein n=1 Tax=Bathymodiolus thermophilus thioautotrophic gill symbiont TaxID=2360 RepID=A0A8H8XCQ6_9GAMM|nr:RHS repeat-associated core domain-containing protein [Bathymodiolus thermophilus thioautotrophic gill symbiont]CAB5499814.1 hypothetical protein THERMOS_1093 [Bathymodiolus thermophilus thioautotrophic gill symbiont]CAB5501674.1 hypothetical protein THERMOT_1468 [Bathymodiolus thermophilus thioautotrophic gill symbiont]SGZ66407.1 insecticidal toxin complex protein [Bathymodiolus thermophilus thioautotrophic gill symbiont]
MNALELYHQTYTYDTSNNLTHLSHQANSNTWQQTIAIHPHNNRGTETPQSTTDFDTNGNLLTLNNIGTLRWHYNNTLNKLTQQDKGNATEYYVYDHQGNRVRTVIESNKQIQSQRNYLPSLDTSTNKAKQQANTLHIGTHILSEINKDNPQTRYQLSSHLKTNTLELNDQAQIISYESYSPYGTTTLIAGKNKTQVQQKRYRYTGKERDDSSGLCYYGARYLAPWMARWISPDSTGTVNGLNLYTYVGNNPLKYIDPTGHVRTTADQKDTEVKKMAQIMKIQKDILKSNVFKELGALESSSRFVESRPTYDRLDEAIEKLRFSTDKRITELKKDKGLSHMSASIRFYSSDEFKEMVFKKYKIANCGESADVMLHGLSEKYFDMPVESIRTTSPDHTFNIINRDQSTSIFEPEKWNEDTLVVDAWAKFVLTKQEFLRVNLSKYHRLAVYMTGDTEQVIKHKGVVSVRFFLGTKLKGEESRF